MYYIGCLSYYGLNLNSIIEQYCVNKDKPQLHCDGKCFLAEQLNKASDSNENSSDKFLSVIFESFIPVYISPQTEVKFYNFNIVSTEEGEFKYCNSYSFLHASSNFKPPILKFNI